MEGMNGTKGQAAEPSEHAWTCMYGILVTWLIRMKKDFTRSKHAKKERCEKKQCVTREGKRMERMDRTKQQRVLLLVYVWVAIITWLTRVGKQHAASEQEGHKEIKGGEKASSRATRRTQQRRIIQRRISRWNKTRKVKAKDWKKYRHK
eukprot:6198964-Pleurochrysis_carterae.AAC.1